MKEHQGSLQAGPRSSKQRETAAVLFAAYCSVHSRGGVHPSSSKTAAQRSTLACPSPLSRLCETRAVQHTELPMCRSRVQGFNSRVCEHLLSGTALQFAQENRGCASEHRSIPFRQPAFSQQLPTHRLGHVACTTATLFYWRRPKTMQELVRRNEARQLLKKGTQG